MRSVLRHVAGGWQLSNVFQAESGSPFSVLMPCAAINAQGNNCRPNRISSGVLPADQHSINEWFNTSAFVTPSPFAYGDAGRNILRGPGSATVDAALAKSFTWGGNGGAPFADSLGGLQFAESHQSGAASKLYEFARVWAPLFRRVRPA